jgi:MFS family permease
LGPFYFGAPLAFILGGPISGLLLDMDGVLGLHGWQWMFMVEGLLAAATGVWAYFYIDDKPADAAWLDAEEKRVLNAAVEEEQDKRRHGPHGVLAALRNPGVLYLSEGDEYLKLPALSYLVIVSWRRCVPSRSLSRSSARAGHRLTDTRGGPRCRASAGDGPAASRRRATA